jgi:hypothetical protein
MRNTVITAVVLLALPFLLIPAFPGAINAGNWKFLLAAGFAIAVLGLAVGWIGSRDDLKCTDSA